MGEPFKRGLIRDLQYLPFLFKMVDIFLIYTSILVLSMSVKVVELDASYSSLILITLLIFFFTAEATKLYQSWRGVDFISVVQRVAFVWLITIISLVILGYFLKVTSDFSRILVSTWFVLTPIVLLLWRLLFRLVLNYFRGKGYNSRNVAFLGDNHLSHQVIEYIKGHPSLGMNIEGVYDDRSVLRTQSMVQITAGCSEVLVEKAKKGEVDLIYISLPMKAETRIKELIDKLADTTVSVYMIPDMYIYQLFNGSWSNLAGHPIVSVFESPFKGMDAFAKRVQDIIISIFVLLLIFPIMIIISIAVKATSPGPILFKQRRYGVAGEDIMVWKFRSMVIHDNDNEVKQATRNDSRVTRLGSFLRRTSLDELPQFMNVLMGDMSIVGPRPHAAEHNELYRKKIRGYMLRHAVKPGITGWAQINGWRGETDTLEKMQSRIDYDHWYISHWSIWLDLKIIFLTIFKGFLSSKTY